MNKFFYTLNYKSLPRPFFTFFSSHSATEVDAEATLEVVEASWTTGLLGDLRFFPEVGDREEEVETVESCNSSVRTCFRVNMVSGDESGLVELEGILLVGVLLLAFPFCWEECCDAAGFFARLMGLTAFLVDDFLGFSGTFDATDFGILEVEDCKILVIHKYNLLCFQQIKSFHNSPPPV